MRTWSEYKQTVNKEASIFNWAREANLSELKKLNLDSSSVNVSDGKGYSALMLAAYHGHQDVCEFLIRNEADVNAKDNSGSSILMGASFKGHLEIVRLLVNSGADVTYENSKRQSALDFAQMFGRADVVKYLKTKKNQDGVFGILDVIQGWSSVFNFKGAKNEK
ncbi:MAG: ankyrin repeat domain-containing protein [Pseudobdellovibrio sp.]